MKSFKISISVSLFLILTGLLSSGRVFADALGDQHHTQATIKANSEAVLFPNCQKIDTACKTAGWAGTGAFTGYLTAMCREDIMNGKNVKGPGGQSLPTVDPTIQAACVAEQAAFVNRPKGSNPGEAIYGSDPCAQAAQARIQLGNDSASNNAALVQADQQALDTANTNCAAQNTAAARARSQNSAPQGEGTLFMNSSDQGKQAGSNASKAK